MKNTFLKMRGFTLVEILVVLAIISVLASIVMVSVSDARANARDKARISDISQLVLTMRLYVEQYGSDVDCEGGLKIDGSTTLESSGVCNDSAQILAFIQAFSGRIPNDPLGPGDGDHYYYFDNNHDCGGSPAVPIIFAVNLEQVASNQASVCPTAVAGNDGGYVNNVFMGGAGASEPYVEVLNFSNQI